MCMHNISYLSSRVQLQGGFVKIFQEALLRIIAYSIEELGTTFPKIQRGEKKDEWISTVGVAFLPEMDFIGAPTDVWDRSCDGVLARRFICL